MSHRLLRGKAGLALRQAALAGGSALAQRCRIDGARFDAARIAPAGICARKIYERRRRPDVRARDDAAMGR